MLNVIAVTRSVTSSGILFVPFDSILNIKDMKTSGFRLVTPLLMCGLLFSAYSVRAQEAKLTRQEKKEAEKAVKLANFQILDSLLQAKNFVLEADWLENQYGTRVPVLSSLNFIMMKPSKVILQTGNRSGQGLNGVGGTTAEGSISGLKIVKNVKNLSFYVRFTLTSDIGIYDVAMDIYSFNYARATITGMSLGKLVYDGRIETIDNSSVFKGRNTI